MNAVIDKRREEKRRGRGGCHLGLELAASAVLYLPRLLDPHFQVQVQLLPTR